MLKVRNNFKNIRILQGTTYFEELFVKTGDYDYVDLGEWQLFSQIRKSHSTASKIDFVCERGEDAGSFTLLLTPDVTLNMDAGYYVYDAIMVQGEDIYESYDEALENAETIYRIAQGEATVDPGVTR